MGGGPGEGVAQASEGLHLTDGVELRRCDCLAGQRVEKKLKGVFPHCLDGAPLLLHGGGSQLRSGIDQWLEKQRIHPRMIAEFDDESPRNE